MNVILSMIDVRGVDNFTFWKTPSARPKSVDPPGSVKISQSSTFWVTFSTISKKMLTFSRVLNAATKSLQNVLVQNE